MARQSRSGSKWIGVDAGGEGAGDVIDQGVAHVDGGARVRAGELEGDLEDARVGLGDADHGRVDDGCAGEAAVAQVLLAVAVGVGDDHDGDAGAFQGGDRLGGARCRLAPEDLAGARTVGQSLPHGERLPGPSGDNSKLGEERALVVLAGRGAVEGADRAVVGAGYGVGVDFDADLGQRAREQVAIGEHEHAAGVEKDRAAGEAIALSQPVRVIAPAVSAS